MTATDRTGEPSAVFAAARESWEAREADPAGWEQRVEAAARAMGQEQNRGASWDLARGYVRDEYRRLAAAALTADAAHGVTR